MLNTVFSHPIKLHIIIYISRHHLLHYIKNFHKSKARNICINDTIPGLTVTGIERVCHQSRDAPNTLQQTGELSSRCKCSRVVQEPIQERLAANRLTGDVAEKENKANARFFP